MAYTRFNYLERVREIQQYARAWYEPGRQDRCWRWVWKHHVRDKYFMDYQTFLNMLKIDVEKDVEKEQRRLVEKSQKDTLFEGMDI